MWCLCTRRVRYLGTFVVSGWLVGIVWRPVFLLDICSVSSKISLVARPVSVFCHALHVLQPSSFLEAVRI